MACMYLCLTEEKCLHRRGAVGRLMVVSLSPISVCALLLFSVICSCVCPPNWGVALESTYVHTYRPQMDMHTLLLYTNDPEASEAYVCTEKLSSALSMFAKCVEFGSFSTLRLKLMSSLPLLFCRVLLWTTALFLVLSLPVSLSVYSLQSLSALLDILPTCTDGFSASSES